MCVDDVLGLNRVIHIAARAHRSLDQTDACNIKHSKIPIQGSLGKGRRGKEGKFGSSVQRDIAT